MPTPQGPRRAALFITNLTKLGGLVIGVHEALTTRDPAVMAFAAFMMAGARVSETVLLTFIDRFFAKGTGHE